MAKTKVEEHIKRLKSHLRLENPALAEAVGSFQELDRIARRLGFMDASESFATQVSWWPVVAVLGTFSAGKSTFLNQYLGLSLQRTGNQAVDDKFTVICYGSEEQPKQLPGLALDSDPRFPFYRISKNIESVSGGEGGNVDSYLQLKTANTEALRGKIFIDSPGFDADKQRTSTLLLTDHIIDLSDLVLVFFDARHPEPGAMTDTLQHLVSETVNRRDSAKFLYILNQIDNTAREDNPEEVVAAWQRALAQSGLTAGRFYRIYAQGAAVHIEDVQVRERMESKRDQDLSEIKARIHQLGIERSYRVTSVLENSARHVRDVLVPQLVKARKTWLRRTWWLNAMVFGVAIAAFLFWSITENQWDGFTLIPFAELSTTMQIATVLVVLAVAVYIQALLRRLAGRSVERAISKDESLPPKDRESVLRAYRKNLKAWWHSFSSRPLGWSSRTRRKLEELIAESDRLVQSLNDRYTSPSGRSSDERES